MENGSTSRIVEVIKEAEKPENSPSDHPVVSFLRSFFKDCYREACIHLRFIQKDGTVIGSEFVPISELNRIPSILEKYKDLTPYFAITTKGKGFEGEEGVVEIPYLWVDIDKNDVIPEEWERKLREIKEFPLRPTWIVDSGDERDIYWRLKETHGGDAEGEIGQIKKANEMLASYFGGDFEKGLDVSTVLRLPGTLNFKYHPPVPCTILETNPECRYEIGDLYGAHESLTVRATTVPARIEDLRDFILLNTEKLNAYRAKVRAARKLNVAKELRDKGVEEGQILATEVFYAEAKLGELLKELHLRGGDRKSESFRNQTSYGRGLNSLGINETQSSEAQKMAAHPEAIEAVLKKARKENEIPYKSQILKWIGNPEYKTQRYVEAEEKKREILSQLDRKPFEKHFSHIDRICLTLLPRLYKYELSMEELLDRINYFKEKGEPIFNKVSEQKPIKQFLGSCFTQDFIAILQAFGFKIEWPEGITLSPRTGRYQGVKEHRKKMGYYRRKGKLRARSSPKRC